MVSCKNLSQLKPGEKAIVTELRVTGSIHRRLLDIGLIENTEIECLGKSPCGDPCAFLIRGAVIAIRSEDCENILVETVSATDFDFVTPDDLNFQTPHWLVT